MLTIKKSLLTKVVNNLMAYNKQPYSQVFVYLVNSGNRYICHSFKTLFKAKLDKYIAQFK